jgi:ABC-type dipeptide/oligopeptide/nickel transport system ATPase component
MWNAFVEGIKRLRLGFVLLLAVATILLLFDLKSRKRSSQELKNNVHRIAIVQHASIKALDDGRIGFLDKHKDRGYADGKNVTPRIPDAEGDIGTANAIASRREKSRGFGWSLNRILRAEIAERLCSLKMGLEDRLDSPIGNLSGGQRQAITLLMATWHKPDLLLLDEHTAALDPRSADQVIRVTDEIIARDRLTALMVTHSMQQAVSLGNRIVMMHQGQIVCDLSGTEKARARPDDLLGRFDAIRRSEQLTPAVAELLRRSYI